MACGCVDNSCACIITGGSGVVVSGAGSVANPFVVSAAGGSDPAWTGINTDGGITITPGGVNGHSPVINLNLDPASPAALSVGVDGLSVACCGVGALGSVFTQSYQYDFAELGGAVGSIALTDLNNVAQQMPAGSMITNIHIDIVTPFTSAGDPVLMLGWNTVGFEGAFFNDVMSVFNSQPSGIIPFGSIIINNDIHPVDVDFTLDIGAPDPLTGGVLRVYLTLGQFI